MHVVRKPCVSCGMSDVKCYDVSKASGMPCCGHCFMSDTHPPMNDRDDWRSHVRLQVGELEELGYEIDKSTYPWFAYKGPRFNPDVSFLCRTPAWRPR